MLPKTQGLSLARAEGRLWFLVEGAQEGLQLDWHSERTAGPLSARGGRYIPVPLYACSAIPTAEDSEIAKPQAEIPERSAGRSKTLEV